MKAVQYSAYGGIDRLSLVDVKPDPLRRGDIRVAVFYASLNPKDALFRKGKFRAVSGRSFPKRCGLDFAGEVLESDDPALPRGQRVFGMLDELTFRRGTLAEETIVRGEECAVLPPGVELERAAVVPLVGLTALQALRNVARLRPGGRVLINGASGGVGTAAIQIARLLDAEVTTISSGANLGLCRQLGASETRDYAQPGFLDGRFDCIFDVYGNLHFSRARSSLAAGGVFVSTVPTPRRVLREIVARVWRQPERLVAVRANRADLDQLARWLADGRIAAVIDARHRLADFAEGFRRLESKRTRGKILIQVR